MDITLSGKIFVYFIRSVFESKQKIGVEIIIDPHNSDNQLIDGLNRLNKINKNKIFIKIDNIEIPLKIYDTRYTCNATFQYINNIDDKSNLILKEINGVKFEKTKIIVDNKFRLQNYATSKQKTINQIMNLIC